MTLENYAFLWPKVKQRLLPNAQPFAEAGRRPEEHALPSSFVIHLIFHKAGFRTAQGPKIIVKISIYPYIYIFIYIYLIINHNH